MKQNHFEWTPESRALAKALWAKGESATVIAAKFKVSRNAILGLASRFRDDFPARREGASAKRIIRRKPSARPPATKKAEAERPAHSRSERLRPAANLAPRCAPAPAAPNVRAEWLRAEGESVIRDLTRFRLEGAEPIAFADLRRGQCQFPLSSFEEKGGPAMPYCGAKAETGSYCQAHYRLSVQGVRR